MQFACQWNVRSYCLFIAVSSSDVSSLSLRNSEILGFSLLLHPYAQDCIPRLPISCRFSNLYLVCLRERSAWAESVSEKSASFYCWRAFCTLISICILSKGPKRGFYSQFPSSKFHQILLCYIFNPILCFPDECMPIPLHGILCLPIKNWHLPAPILPC